MVLRAPKRPSSGKEKKPQLPKKKKQSWASRLIMLGFSVGCVVAITGIGAVAAVLFYYSQDLPDFRALEKYEPPIVTRAFASDGRLLAEFAAERRVFVPIESVPKRVVYAFLSAEDKNFYRHPGIDVEGILSAIVDNVMSIGSNRRLRGASTITQQVAKNFLLTNEVSIARKVREMLLAFRIEQTLPKDKILELYLNEIFLGARSYGVAAAALEYFNKPLDELTLEEVAYLAALPKAPNNYSPQRHYAAAVARRNWVIDQMAENEYATTAEADIAKLTPLEVVERDNSQYVNYPYFAEEVRRKLLELYGKDGLYTSGLIAHTTLVPEYQRLAEEALRYGLLAYDMRHGLHSKPLGQVDLAVWQTGLGGVNVPPDAGNFEPAVILSSNDKQAVIGLPTGKEAVITLNKMKWALTSKQPAKVSALLRPGDVWLVENADEKLNKKDVYWLRQIPNVQGGIIVMDPHTGRIFAMAGGFSYNYTSQFNRATQAIRQPGSAFKPFVYLAGLEAGFTPATLILDAPFVFDQGPGLDKWRPQNYTEDFGGPTTLRGGLEKSRNLMTIRLANYVGMPKIAEISHKFGIIDNLPPLLSMSIGAGETTLLRMVSGYSIFVNGGKKIEPTLLDRIQDRNGKTIYVHDKSVCDDCGPLMPWTAQAVPDIPDNREQIADPRYMYQIVSMLEGVVQRGTGVMMRDIGRPVAGKTGTTNDAKDAWFIGFTPNIIVGTYVGFDEPHSMGEKETGSRVAVPIVKEFMQNALKAVPPVPFRVPEGIRLVQINAATGTRAKPGDEQTLLESFIVGTEPGDEPMMFTGQGVSTVSDVTNVGEGANTGLGGIY